MFEICVCLLPVLVLVIACLTEAATAEAPATTAAPKVVSPFRLFLPACEDAPDEFCDDSENQYHKI